MLCNLLSDASTFHTIIKYLVGDGVWRCEFFAVKSGFSLVTVPILTTLTIGSDCGGDPRGVEKERWYCFPANFDDLCAIKFGLFEFEEFRWIGCQVIWVI